MHQSTPRPAPTRSRALAACGVVALLTSACTSNSDDETGQRVAVTSTDDGCDVAETSVPAGGVVFDVTNDGSASTEFYLYEADGVGIVGEVENIGPGISRELLVQVTAGDYLTACKPGMTGGGIRAPFTVTDE